MAGPPRHAAVGVYLRYVCVHRACVVSSGGHTRTARRRRWRLAFNGMVVLGHDGGYQLARPRRGFKKKMVEVWKSCEGGHGLTASRHWENRRRTAKGEKGWPKVVRGGPNSQHLFFIPGTWAGMAHFLGGRRGWMALNEPARQPPSYSKKPKTLSNLALSFLCLIAAPPPAGTRSAAASLSRRAVVEGRTRRERNAGFISPPGRSCDQRAGVSLRAVRRAHRIGKYVIHRKVPRPTKPVGSKRTQSTAPVGKPLPAQLPYGEGGPVDVGGR